MTAALELRLQFAKVVYLAIENDCSRAVFTGDRLVATGKVDNRQTPHSQRHPVLNERPGVVWSAIPDDLAHFLKDACAVLPITNVFRVPEIDKSGDATHQSLLCHSDRGLGHSQCRKLRSVLKYILLMLGHSKLDGLRVYCWCSLNSSSTGKPV